MLLLLGDFGWRFSRTVLYSAKQRRVVVEIQTDVWRNTLPPSQGSNKSSKIQKWKQVTFSGIYGVISEDATLHNQRCEDDTYCKISYLSASRTRARFYINITLKYIRALRVVCYVTVLWNLHFHGLFSDCLHERHLFIQASFQFLRSTFTVRWLMIGFSTVQYSYFWKLRANFQEWKPRIKCLYLFLQETVAQNNTQIHK